MRAAMNVRPLPELVLETGTLLVADLHLDLAPGAGEGARLERERFQAWLAGLDAPRLVILGDLFDAWVGPAHARLDAAAEVIAGLARLTRRGTAVDVVVGNRDFLLDAHFERASGARVFPRGVLARPAESAGGRPWLLIHGDELCTDDQGYQRLKRVLRSRAVTWAAPRLPGAVALFAAKRLRRASVRALASKPRASAEQKPGAVRALAAAHGAELVVCGHAHSFKDERQDGVRWVVVGAFGTSNDLLRVGAGGRLEPRETRVRA
jgi:UDP-2,3-diacylglucosamine hydrolase